MEADLAVYDGDPLEDNRAFFEPRLVISDGRIVVEGVGFDPLSLGIRTLNASLLVWLTPTLAATFAWGIAQGLVKKYIGEVPPARFCLYYAVANAAVNILFWASQDAPPILAPEGHVFLMVGLLAYVLEGIAWIFDYQSIVYGPISIVGTLSAAYPALTVIFANRFLGESLSPFQVVGVVGVIAGCLSLAYSPPDPWGRRPRSAGCHSRRRRSCSGA